MKRTKRKKLVDNGDDALLLGLAADEIEIALLGEDDEDDDGDYNNTDEDEEH